MELSAAPRHTPERRSPRRIQHVVAALPWAVAIFATPTLGADLEAGDIAPDFALEGTDGATWRLSELLGEDGVAAVVLAWFPKAYTRGCTIECKSLAENGHLLRTFDARYFMASTDPIEDNIGFATANKADFPLLSDPTKATASAYGVLTERGFAARHTFYIGPGRVILAVDRAVKPATSAEDMAAKLAALSVPRRSASADAR